MDSHEAEKDELYVARNGGNRSLMFWIIIAGLANFGGSMLQQYSLVYLDAPKVVFITGSYVVFVPFVEWLLPACCGYMPNCLSPRIWMGVVLCVIGLYFVSGCYGQSSCFSMDSTEALATIAVMISAIFWAVSIMVGDLASKQVDCLTVTMGEFVVVVVLTSIVGMDVEPAQWTYPFTVMRDNWKVIVFTGVFEGFAFFMATVGQMHVRPSRASILYSGTVFVFLIFLFFQFSDLLVHSAGDSLFTTIGSYFFLNEMLSMSEMFGGLLMIIAAIVSGVDPEEDLEFEEEQVQQERQQQMPQLTYPHHQHHMPLSPRILARHRSGSLQGQGSGPAGTGTVENRYVAVEMKYGAIETLNVVINVATT